MHECPGMCFNGAITASRKLMDGHKKELFILGLSFIGWWILVIVTLGLATLYVMPYQQVTTAGFFAKLIEDGRASGLLPSAHRAGDIG